MYALAVEPDTSTADRLLDCLSRLGYRARSVVTGHDALRELDGSDLVLLDLNLPDLDGLGVCRRIREAGDTPLIAFAGAGDERRRVLSLQAGADDCMTKPYGLPEVAARIQAVTRRTGSRERTGVMRHGELRVDPDRRHVSVGGRPVPLTRKEFELLRLLVSDTGRVFSRQELMSRVWQDDDAAARLTARTSRTLDTHVGTLRGKLGSRSWVVTVRGVGYRLGGVVATGRRDG